MGETCSKKSLFNIISTWQEGARLPSKNALSSAILNGEKQRLTLNPRRNIHFVAGPSGADRFYLHPTKTTTTLLANPGIPYHFMYFNGGGLFKIEQVTYYTGFFFLSVFNFKSAAFVAVGRFKL